MPLTVRIYQDDLVTFRSLRIAFDMTCGTVLTLCCQKYGFPSALVKNFCLYEWQTHGGAAVRRVIARTEIVSSIVQKWQEAGHSHDSARLLFAIPEQTMLALLARASAVQMPDQQSQYAALVQVPDISQLMNSLVYYFGKMDVVTCVETLRNRAEGTYLLRDGVHSDAIVLSYVSAGQVYHIAIKYDVHGFYLTNSGERFQDPADLLTRLAELQYPLGGALTYNEAGLFVSLSNEIRSFPCFFGAIRAEKAEEILTGQRNGVFLIRESSREGCFATSYVHDGKVKHSLVACSQEGLSTPGDQRFYVTLELFVDASQMMFFGLPRAGVNFDDSLMGSLGIREPHQLEIENAMRLAAQQWEE